MKYSSVGIVSLTIDFIFYNFFIYVVGISASNSKVLSFICGALNSFFMNKNFTFNSKEKNLIQPFKFIILYLISLYFNSETHDFFLEFDIIYLPFVAATLVSVAINFSGQKFWVFKKVK